MSPHEDIYGSRKRLDFICDAIRDMEPASVLDIGCGVGQVSYPLARRFPDIKFHGVDSDVASIEFARINRIADNLTFGFPGEESNEHKYDLIIASEVIEHVHAPGEFLRSLRARLSDSGRLVLTLPNGYGPFELAAFVEAILKLIGVYGILRSIKSVATENARKVPAEPITFAVSPHINFFTYSAITDLLVHTGFAIERYSARTFLCGFGFDQIMRGERILGWNCKIADRLPAFVSSDWMFVAKPVPVNGEGRPYRPGPLARLRRFLYEKQCGLR